MYNKQTQVKVALLFEHKSYPDKYVIFQILRYILKIWEKHTLKDGNPPMIVIPIIFYHGKEAWQYTSLEKYFENVDVVLQKFIPSFGHLS